MYIHVYQLIIIQELKEYVINKHMRSSAKEDLSYETLLPMTF